MLATVGALALAAVAAPASAAPMAINLDTGDVSWNGNESPIPEDQACAALTG